VIKTIVVGTDGSQTAHKAVDQATDLAAKLGAELHIVSGYKLPAPAYPGEAVVVPVTESEIRASVEALLADAASTAQDQGVPVSIHARSQAAAQALLEVASECGADLIVVGSRGMNGARRVLGSVPNNITHHAECNVLVVHTT
jgi:nucleotide-binding universal stress UspA family protein